MSRSCRVLLLRCALAGLVTVQGCTSVDRWHIFQADAESVVEEDGAARIAPLPVRMAAEKAEDSQGKATIPAALSIEDAVLLALRNNSELQVNQFAPVVAGAFEQIERGFYDPELFAEARHLRERRERGSLDETVRQTDLIAGLRQSLPSGTVVEAAIGQEGSSYDDDEDEQRARVELNITQSLLRGYGSAVNLVRVRQAELETLASIDELKGFVNSLLADTEITYWQYVLALEEIAIFERSLQLARKQREEIEISIEVGFLPEFELAAARAEEALRVQALIDARSMLEDRRLRLLRLISAEAGGNPPAQLTATSEPRTAAQPIDMVDEHLHLAERLRPDLAEARLRLRLNRLETVMTRNGLLPRLELFMSLGKTGYGASFRDSFSELDGDSSSVTTGIRLSHALGNRSAQGRHLAAVTQQRQAEKAIDNLRQIVRLDVLLAINEVERLRRQIDASRETRIFQERTLAAEKERFDVGSSTALLVAQAQRDLLQAQIAEVETIVSYRMALVQLYLAEGSLMERRGIDLAAGR